MRQIYPALKAIIFHKGKILIIKRSKNEDSHKSEWDIPGGGVKFGENPLTSLKREVREETGLGIIIKKPLSVWTFLKNKKNTQVVGITVLCKCSSGKVSLSKEHVDFRWIHPREITKFEIHDGIKTDVKKAVKEII